MKKITLVATSHIAEESLKKIEEIIEKEKPDVVAVELDRGRYESLKGGQASLTETIKALGFFSFFIYFLMKKLQEWLGKMVGILPGSDMLKAIEVAKRRKLLIAFIDRDIRLTLAGFNNISRGEKFKLFWFLIKGIFGVAAFKVKGGSIEGIDLRKVPQSEIIEEAMLVLKKELPQLYRILVEERDEFMASRLKILMRDYDNVVAVIGAGHKKGMTAILNKDKSVH
jgi:pheromone shutdown-related protein TraB